MQIRDQYHLDDPIFPIVRHVGVSLRAGARAQPVLTLADLGAAR